jgi:arylformamidase
MLVYKQYDQAALDLQYNNRLQVPEWADHLERWERTSRDAEKKYSPIKDIAYGEGPLENLDIFPSSQPHSKVLVFIHGGYWHKLDKSDFQFIGAGFHSYNITTIIINYPLAPIVTIDQIVQSCRKALFWIKENIAAYNGDPQQLYVAGHSAGGHLAAMLMTEAAEYSGWSSSMKDIKGLCAMSGLFNLEPLRLSNINEVLQLDEQAVWRNSPVNWKPAFACPLLIAVGGNETDEYKSQSEELFNSWKGSGMVQLEALAGANHYSIIEEAVKPGRALHDLIKKQLGL